MTTETAPAVRISDKLAGKVHDLLEQNRVYQSERDPWVCVVAGEAGWYRVRAFTNGVACSCEHQGWRCAHALAALAKWGETVVP